MTNEEAIEELKRIDTDLLKTADCGNKTSECMAAGRGRKAMRLAIKALEIQERMQRELKSLDGIAETCDKLEEALAMAVRDSDKSGTDIWCHDCPYGDNERLDNCSDCGVDYYKRLAGIEVAE